MITKVFSILLFVLSAFAAKGTTSDTLVVIFDKQQFVQGDSIEMEVYSEPFKSNQPAQTLHLWIDNIKTGQRWKFRYPYLKGRYKFSLKISDSIPDGLYAFYFLVQNKFLAVKGTLKNPGEADKAINYMATAKNRVPIIDGVELDAAGSFKIENLFYTDSVYFGFSPAKKSKINPLKVSLETALDSTFIPESSIAELITIGYAVPIPVDYVGNNIISSLNRRQKDLLKEVVVQTKTKTKRKQFEEQNVSGLFDSENSITLDFYDSDELNGYTDIYSYLVTKMPGLRIQTNPENGQPLLYWRNDKTDIYVDEFADTDFSPYSISMQDIEMIKIYRPGNRMGLDGLGGSVAIYTKRRSNRPGNKLSNYSFYVKGYTQKNAEWK